MIVVLCVDSTKNIWSLLLQNNGYKIIFGDYIAVLFIGIRGMYKFGLINMEVEMGDVDTSDGKKNNLVCFFEDCEVPFRKDKDEIVYDNEPYSETGKMIKIEISGPGEIDLKNYMKGFLDEYRGKLSGKNCLYKCGSKLAYGYSAASGKEKSNFYCDFVSEEYIRGTSIRFNKIDDNNQEKPSDLSYDRRFYTGDFRRIVADAFFAIYKQLCDKEIQIDTISFYKDKEKDPITSFTIDQESTKSEFDNWNDDGYANFWCISKNDSNSEIDSKKIGFPICLKYFESRYEECSSDFYYELVNRKSGKELTRYLNYYDIHNVAAKSQYEVFNKAYNIALFSGEDKNWGKGIFYFYNGELYPKMVIKDSEIKIYDVRSHFRKKEQKLICEYNVECDNDDFQKIIKDYKNIDYKNFEQICMGEAFRAYGSNSNYNNEFKLEKNACFFKNYSGSKNDFDSIIIKYEGEKTYNLVDFDYYWKGKLNSIEIYFECEDGNSVVKIINGSIYEAHFSYKSQNIEITYRIRDLKPSGFTDRDLENLLNNVDKFGVTFKDQLKFVEDNIEIIGNIVKKLVSLINDSQNENIVNYLVENSRDKNELNIEDFEKKLFEGLLPDRTVTNQVYDEVKKWRKEKEEEKEDKGNKHPKIPNLVIMGSPGTGKTTLAKRIAKCFSDNDDPNDDVTKKEGNFYQVSPSDLKGAYVGQTIPKVYDLLKGASEKKQILFLDEAYLLQEDQFGREALAYLLPVMSGDRKIIIKEFEEIETDGTKLKTGKKIEAFNFVDDGNGIPPIWMAGYEHQMRKTLSENPGLYRRMVKLRLQSPTASNLYENLMILADNNPKLKEKFGDQSIQKDIKNYFIWAIARENSEYFGNYAGVQKFYETCEIREVATSNRAHDLINTIIEENKKEIKAQYAAVLSKNEKSRKFVVSRDIDTTFKDVIGEAVTKKLKPIVDMLIDHEKYYECGINVPKGALLVGSPGTGKTLLARAVAGEFQQSQKELDSDKQIAFISVIGTELSTPELVEELFSEAADYDAAIIFIDEIDSMGVKREYSHNPEPMFQLLKEMDGFEQRTNIFVMAATNAPEILDEALKRPGRFDRYIEVSYPTKEERKAIIKMYVEKLKWFRYEQSKENSNDETNNVSSDVANDNWDKLYNDIANKTKSFTPAQLKNLINEAAIDFYSLTPAQLKKLINEDALNEDSLRLDQLDVSLKLKAFENLVNEKIEQLIIGDKKPKPDEAKFSVEENKGCSAVAIHEVGHAMVCLLQGMEPFEKITILPRGNALGYVTPSSNNSLWTKQDYLNQIRALMGGRVAEELFYGEDDISVGAAQDIQSATKLAENMVAIFGMSEKIGVMSVKSDTSNFLGSVSKFECSESFRYDVEIEVRNLLRTQLEIVREELKKQKDIIKEMAETVYGVETMSGDDFKEKYNEKRKEIEESSKKLRDSVSYDA